MNKQFDAKELHQYTDGELSAELLAEYPVAKQTQLEAPHLSRLIPQSNPQSDRPRNRKRNCIRCMFFIVALCLLCTSPIWYVFGSIYYEEVIEVAIKERYVKNWLEKAESEVFSISEDDKFIEQPELDISVQGTLLCVYGNTDFIFRSERAWTEIVADYTNSLGEDWEVKHIPDENNPLASFTQPDAKFDNYLRIYPQEDNIYQVDVAMGECWGG